MKVIVSGLTASGKSSVSKSLADKFGLEYFSASSKLREILPRKDFEVWESRKGIDAVRFRLKNPGYDRKLDAFINSLFRKSSGIVMDSWVASWKIKDKDTIKVYIKADKKIRAGRVSIRDGITLKQAMEFMSEKDRLTAEIYRKIYKIDVEKDFTPFDIVIDSSYLDLEDTVKLCSDFIINQQKVKL